MSRTNALRHVQISPVRMHARTVPKMRESTHTLIQHTVTHCNTHCNTHCTTHCNTHCNTLPQMRQSCHTRMCQSNASRHIQKSHIPYAQVVPKMKRSCHTRMRTEMSHRNVTHECNTEMSQHTYQGFLNMFFSDTFSPQ